MRGRVAARWSFFAIAVLALPLLVWLSFDFGVTWDEKSRHRYGEMIWEYLRGMRPRADFLVEDGGHLYGGLFDTICAALETYLPFDRYVVRHGVNAVFGWIGVLYSGRLATRVFGAWAGVLAMILLLVSPRYLGDAMNNPKDLPFAALSMMALFYMSTVSSRFPYVSWATGVKVGLALALALNVRAAALLYLGYFGMLVIGYAAAERAWTRRQVASVAGRLMAVSLGALVLGTVFWPWAQSAPAVRPIQALLGFAGFPYSIGMLYGGDVILSDAPPLSYVPWWMLITTPPVVLMGALLALGLGRRRHRLSLALLTVVFLLPVALVIAMGSTLYDGVRHLLFVYPLLVVAAAGGWTIAMTEMPGAWLRRVAGGLLAAGVVSAAAFEVASHPNEIVYFNPIVGGPRGAFARYEMDYWGNCLLEAVAWTANVAQRSGRAVTLSGEPWQVIQLDAGRFPQVQFTPPHRNEHQFDVRLARGSVNFITTLVNSPDLLYRVTTHDGATLCVVLRGPAYAQLAPFAVMPPAGLSARALLRP